MDPTRTRLILGPPGTGKTTKLISIVEDAIKSGVKPNEICVISFTKRASNEAKERAQAKFKLSDEDVKLFRTIHSLAFQQMNFEPRNVMSFSNYCDICKLLGLSISSQKVEEDGFIVVHTKGDRLFFLENLARTSKKTLRQTFDSFINDDLDFRELELLSLTIAKYKEIHNKIDFTDMVVRFVEHGQFQKLKLLIVDESQDLSPIQWDVVNLLSKVAEQIVIAGDDDQAIYTWAGADVQNFLDIRGAKEILIQSYRIPQKVHKLANSIIQKISKRNIKDYFPKKEEGCVEHIADFESLDMNKGTWLLLSRNIFLLNEFSKYCVRKGYLFTSRYGSPIDQEAMNAIRSWEALRQGKELPASEVKLLYKYMGTKVSVKFGCKELLDKVPDREFLSVQILQDDFGLLTVAPWFRALNKLKEDEIRYFSAALKQGESMHLPPRIRINTIHGVKGAEADNVVLLTDMSRKTYDEFQKNPDDELRVWYVAVTRTIQNLYIINPSTKYFIDL